MPIYTGTSGNDSLTGTTADDIFTGLAGADTLTGGGGLDLFRDTAAGLNGDTITDLGVGDRIIISDASLANFSTSIVGNQLSYSGGAITLTAVPLGRVIASNVVNNGGVELRIAHAAANDYNGDGRSDVLFRDAGGTMNLWQGRADADFVKAKTGYSIGGVPPIAHAKPSVTLIDQALFRFAEIWAAAGHPHSVFKLSPQDLCRLSGAPVVDVVQGLVAGKVPSPCTSVCRMNGLTGLCEGCYRTIDEIVQWASAEDHAKRTIWTCIEQRRKAGQP